MEVGIAQLAGAVAAGAAVSALYFGGLWLTVRRVPTSPRPHLLAFGSFAVRAAAVVAVMVLIARAHWQLLVAAMAPFVVARMVLIRRLAPPAADEERA